MKQGQRFKGLAKEINFRINYLQFEGSKQKPVTARG